MEPAGGIVAVQYVGGPYAGRREPLIGRQPPAAMFLEAADGQHGVGHYRRSVRCADDGVLRYVWAYR